MFANMLHYLFTAALLATSVVASPILTTRAASAGCGKARTPGYNGPFTINSGGKLRSYKVQVPPKYNANAQYSLIFDFVSSSPFHRIIFTSSNHIHDWINVFVHHGKGGTSDSQRLNSMYHDYTASSQYIVVYPQGVEGSSGTAWQGPSYANKEVDDVLFIKDLLQHFKTNYCINTDRVYASGKSNGGGFVDTLACSDTGDQFAAFAMAAAALYNDTSKESCSKKRAILESHGESDNTIPYTGGQGSGGPIPDIGQWTQFWGERNCGVGATSTTTKKTGYQTTTYSCGGRSNVVSHHRLFKPAGHCWPDSRARNSDAKSIPAGCGDSKVLDFTPVVLDFFSKWSLLNAPR